MANEWIITFPGTDISLRGTGPRPIVSPVAETGGETAGNTAGNTGSGAGSGSTGGGEPLDDDSPFSWPAQPPMPPVDPPEKRNYALTMNDTSPMRWFYATPMSDPNPLPGSHMFAGLLPEGLHVSYGTPPRLVEGLRLWVPSDARPSLIRRALAGRIV